MADITRLVGQPDVELLFATHGNNNYLASFSSTTGEVYQTRVKAIEQNSRGHDLTFFKDLRFCNVAAMTPKGDYFMCSQSSKIARFAIQGVGLDLEEQSVEIGTPTDMIVSSDGKLVTMTTDVTLVTNGVNEELSDRRRIPVFQIDDLKMSVAELPLGRTTGRVSFNPVTSQIYIARGSVSQLTILTERGSGAEGYFFTEAGDSTEQILTHPSGRYVVLTTSGGSVLKVNVR